jgi:hypothetical protein
MRLGVGTQCVGGELPLPYEIVKLLVNLQRRLKASLDNNGGVACYETLLDSIPADDDLAVLTMFMKLNMGSDFKTERSHDKDIMMEELKHWVDLQIVKNSTKRRRLESLNNSI